MLLVNFQLKPTLNSALNHLNVIIFNYVLIYEIYIIIQSNNCINFSNKNFTPSASVCDYT